VIDEYYVDRRGEDHADVQQLRRELAYQVGRVGDCVLCLCVCVCVCVCVCLRVRVRVRERVRS
jgi:hypothetical protein